MIDNFIFQNQYNKTYETRILQFKPEINLEYFKNSEENVTILNSLGNLDDIDGYYACTGVLFISAMHKNTIFQECDLVPKKIEEKPLTNFIYYIEDTTSRIEVTLDENLKHSLLVTGQVLGFLLERVQSEIFLRKYIFPNKIEAEQNTGDQKICFLCDPQVEDSTNEIEIIFQHLNRENYLITDLIIIGKLLKELEKKKLQIFIDSLKNLPMNIHIIPNIGDPTNSIFPLKPINTKLMNVNANFMQNPERFQLGKTFQFVPEQSIKSIKAYQSGKSDIEILKVLRDSRHICPTAPDTIGCIPYTKNDPFFLSKSSEYIFTIANEFFCEKMSKKEKTTFFILPKFSLSKKVVLLDIKNNDFELITLKY